MKIVITGSLGNISKPLSEQLIENGDSITIISNNAGRQIEIENIGAIPAIGSLHDAAFLKESFMGADAAFCMIPPDYTQPDQIAYYRRLGENYKEAILETGVKRVVHLSSVGAHLSSGTGFITGSYHVEQILNTIGHIQLTHIRPTFFYYNLLAFIPMIKSAGFIGAVYGGSDRLPLVSPIDIADAIAQEIVKTGDTQLIRYVGSDDRSCSEVASIIGKAIGKPELKWLTLTKQDAEKSLLKNGLSQEYVEKMLELGNALHTGKLHEDYDLHTPELGKIKMEEYAVKFAALFD
ncbi:NmrA family NAD(P)-binding protein [Pedobacter sp.]|uniref:NmrA family NAD(P)-binding protein n=1 Tax=Pedobacter sp. TaxID=1411316 RepID=UPI0031D1A472